jgi:CHASE2 domain-containing sensor protein
MKDKFVDAILLGAMFLGVYLLDYRRTKRQRSLKVNLCYLVLLVTSGAIMIAASLLPEMPKVIDLFATLFRQG